jgi:hypothetical protein
MENRLQNSPPAMPAKYAQAVIVGLGLISGLIYLFNFKLHPYFAPFGFISNTGIQFYIFLFIILSTLYFSGICLVFRHRSFWKHSKAMVFVIIIFAVIFRACLLPADPSVLSKDMYRYIWDGRVQQNGFNPYQHPPDATELKELRDNEVYPNINRKSYPTLYPAGAQIFFRLFHIIVGDRVFGYKGLMTLFDVVTLFVLLALLRIQGFDETRLIIYAWNPLVIFEIAYSGHLEGLTVFWMVLSLYLHAIHKQKSAIASLAISSAIKLYPALLLPALLNRGERIKGILIFGVTFILLYLPFWVAGRKVLGFLPIYLQNPYESFNLGLKYLVIYLLPQLNYYLLSHFFLLGLMAAGLVVFFKRKQKDQAMRYAYYLMGLLMVLMPASLHAWYVIILLPFLCFYPAVAWILFSCTVSLSYLKYVSPSATMPTSVLMLEYGTLMILLVGGHILRWVAGKDGAHTLSHAGGNRYFLERFG